MELELAWILETEQHCLDPGLAICLMFDFEQLFKLF